MAYFSSEYECKLDAKGRLVLPARIKVKLPEASGNTIVITRGFESCIVLYPLSEWQKVFSKIASLNEFTAEYRNLQRNILRGATEEELDSNGRFLIPKTLLKHAQIDKEAIVVGMGNRIEVWNPGLYNSYLINDQKEFSNLAEKYLGENTETQNSKS
jgi:MraZ protein